MDFFMSKLSGMFDMFGAKIPQVNIPWAKFGQFMDVVNPYLAQANVIFPVDALLAMLVIWGTIRVALLIIWTISFIRRMLPF